jgi:tetratricopeptide (TPR) repeat protein
MRGLGVGAGLVLCAAAVAGLLRLFVPSGPLGATPRRTASAAPGDGFWPAYRDATTRRMAGDCRAAVVSYGKAIALRPAHEDSLYYLGNCHLELGAYGEAIGAYRRLVAHNPDGSPRAYMQWGLAHASLAPGAPHDLEEAERLFQRARDLDPESGALLGLAEVAVLRGEPEKARRLLERASAEDSMSMAAPYLLGYLASRAGEQADAWRQFRLAVERGEMKKSPVAWSEEGDVKADPSLRWRALARQSVLGAHWIRLRAYVGKINLTRDDMEREYALLESALRARPKQ